MTNKQSFTEIFKSHRGKASNKWESYLSIYENIFQNYRQKKISLLEIGIQNGGSLEIYAHYFNNFQSIVGCDIEQKCSLLTYPPNINVIVGDCNNDETVSEIKSISDSFDIIIDDGSHISKDVIITFLKYFRLLKKGGIYVVEDLHTSYWQQWGGGLFYKNSSVSFFKLLVDVVNHENWGLNKSISEFIGTEFSLYQSLLSDEIFSHILSVRFFNSVCVIEKCTEENQNKLVRELVSGTEANVVEETSRLEWTTSLAFRSKRKYLVQL